jgi:hypothetical protein
MGIPLPNYAKIRNNCCIAYLGHASEYIIQLNCLLPYIEAALPGLDIFLCCRDEIISWFDNPKIFPAFQFSERKSDFAFIKQLNCDMENHPVLDLLEESKIKYGPVTTPLNPDFSKRCVICPNATLPAKSLSDVQVDKATQMAKQKEYDVEVTDDITGAGWVIGVENTSLFLAASQGIKTSLVPTGPGTQLYKTMFPDGGTVSF